MAMRRISDALGMTSVRGKILALGLLGSLIPVVALVGLIVIQGRRLDRTLDQELRQETDSQLEGLAKGAPDVAAALVVAGIAIYV